MTTFIIILTIILLVIFIISWILSNRILKPQVRNYDDLYDFEVAEGRLDESLYSSWQKEEFFVESEFGYQLSCMLINNEISKKQAEIPNTKIKIAILVHGYTRGKYSSMIYANYFLKRGITVLAYDHRNHGLSGKSYTTMGYYEKYDLNTIIDWCYSHYDGNVSIITHGESMGAATVLSQLATDTRVYLTIADSGFSEYPEFAKYILKNTYKLPSFPFLHTIALIIRLRAGFSIQDVVPIQGVAISNKPILFIHGLEDRKIPYTMSKDMFEAKANNKDILLVPGAGHVQSVTTDPQTYEKKLNEFLDRYNY